MWWLEIRAKCSSTLSRVVRFLSYPKILHICTDNKFIDQAYHIFEREYPGCNDVYLYSKGSKINYVRLKPSRVFSASFPLFRWGRLTKSDYEKYDLIVFHSLHDSIYPEVLKIEKSKPIIWIGWGFDYYCFTHDREKLFLEKSGQLYKKAVSRSPKLIVYNVLMPLLERFGLVASREKAAGRATLFAPVILSEFAKVRDALDWSVRPAAAEWNYGTMEDDLIKGFEGQSICGDSILIGNSASLNGNQLECFELVTRAGAQDRNLVVPLSYGAEGSAVTEIIRSARQHFGDRAELLTEFMPINDYVEKIRACGFVIMNHIRQQGLGNIVIMLYLGARVFVRQENPVCEFLSRIGVTYSTVQELEQNPSLLSAPLGEDDRRMNRAVVLQYWSRESAQRRTREMVNKALAFDNKATAER